MSRTVYTQIEDGERVKPPMRGYKICCCDCGLIHRMDFFIVRGRVQFEVRRDNRATAAARRRK
jgi:hypothetical protein